MHRGGPSEFLTNGIRIGTSAAHSSQRFSQDTNGSPGQVIVDAGKRPLFKTPLSDERKKFRKSPKNGMKKDA